MGTALRTSTGEMTLKAAREVLGVSSLSTPAEVQAAYREAVKRAHPDSGGDEAAFRQVVEAFRRLQHPEPDPAPAPCAPKPATETLEIGPTMAMLGGEAQHIRPDGKAIRIALPAGLRTGDKVRAGGLTLKIYIRAEAGLLVRGDDLWMNVKLGAGAMKKGGRVAVETPLGRRMVWITGKAADRGLVRLEGQGLPARGRHAKGHLFLRLAAAAPSTDSAALALLRRFASAWAT